MVKGHPSDDWIVPETIERTLEGMDEEQLNALSGRLRGEYDLIHEETMNGSVFAPPSESPCPAAIRAAAICRDIADLLAGS